MKKTIRKFLVPNILLMQLAIMHALGQTAQSGLYSCKATLKDGIITLENNRISRAYQWNEGNIQSTSLTNKNTGHKWLLAGTRSDGYFPGAGKPANGSFKVERIKASSISPAFLKAEVYVKLGSLEVKRIFRIYEDCPAIACDYYLRGTVTGDWADKILNNGELHNIETNDDHAVNGGNVPVMETLALPGPHWNLQTIKFFDITDRNNTLIQENNQLIYRAESRMAGNILFADELLSDQGVFILKEAPTSDVQLAYPGFDFRAHTGSVEAVGFGITPGDVSPDKWTRCYSFVTGVTSGGPLGRLQALRCYQEKVRTHQSGRDEMIMMNTWGDRSQDKHIGEAFTLKELNVAHRLHITHFQVDDGWQSGRSSNSAFQGGTLTNIWDNPNYWKPDPVKFPNGLTPLVEHGKKLGIEICLWFNPSKDSSYAHWKNDAEALISLYKTYEIRTFKIDGVQIIDKKGEVNLRKMFDTVMYVTNNRAVFNLDVTAGRRNGYHYFNTYGNIFLENRYTDWGNYYPYTTLRNLWMLSYYVPAQNLQIEFLNNYRNKDKYATNDSLAPSKNSLEYEFALTIMAQPLAWMEATGLPEQAFAIAPVIDKYRRLQADIHSGQVFPIGSEPSGTSWTGFQSIKKNDGYLLIIREQNKLKQALIKTWFSPGTKVSLETVLGAGYNQVTKINSNGEIKVALQEPNSYVLYHYFLRNK